MISFTRAVLDRANRASHAGRDDEAALLLGTLLDTHDCEPFAVPGGPVLAPSPGPLARARAFLSRAWHRATCRAPACLELYGQFQHPTPNRRALRP